MSDKIPQIHIFAMIISFGILALAFASSIAYLIQDYMLHNKRTIALSKRLPALTTLDSLINRLVGFGFITLSIGILFGSLWSERQIGKWWSWNPKQILALMTWLVYAAYIYSRTLSGWKGKRSVLLIVVGFVLIFVTFIVSLHK